jgi:hypothetical protein
MKKALKSIIVLMLAVAMVLPITALAAETTDRGVLTYEDYITPQYDNALAFSDGYAAVEMDGKWGYIDTTGTLVIPYQFDRAYMFNEGYAIIGTYVDTYDDWVYSWDDEDEIKVTYNTYKMGFVDENGNVTYFNYPRYWDEESTDYILDFEADDTYQGYELLFYNGYFCYGSELFDTNGDLVDLDGYYTMDTR